MDRRQIKQLVELSITDNALDEKKVDKIVTLITRQEAKQYIQGLKKWVREHTVIIEVPKGVTSVSNDIREQFKGKEIVIRENDKLMLGIRIQDNDDIYEMSLSNTLRQMENYILESYDR